VNTTKDVEFNLEQMSIHHAFIRLQKKMTYKIHRYILAILGHKKGKVADVMTVRQMSIGQYVNSELIKQALLYNHEKIIMS
jgi:hypothetical protein